MFLLNLQVYIIDMLVIVIMTSITRLYTVAKCFYEKNLTE